MNASFEKMTVGEVVDAIASAGSLAVLCHTNPDGDTVGSASALALIARGAGVRSEVILPDGRRSDFVSCCLPRALKSERRGRTVSNSSAPSTLRRPRSSDRSGNSSPVSVL
ncbi:MAG: hypothetical protein IKI03_03420 [Clostridia bacterium]|nr:hypothetical protein [Clostridia bacterium]